LEKVLFAEISFAVLAWMSGSSIQSSVWLVNVEQQLCNAAVFGRVAYQDYFPSPPSFFLPFLA